MKIQRFIFFINLALITCCAYFGVILFYGIAASQIRELPQKGEANIITAAHTTRNSSPLSDYQIIVKRDLFKTKTPKPPVQEEKSQNLEELEETQLKLKLWGTVSGSPKAAYAVIEDLQKREQNLYRVGDVIQDAALKEILRGKVILSVNGKDEILTMEEAQQSTSTYAAARSSRSQVAVDRSPPNFADGEPQTRAQRISLNRSMIEDAMKDVSKLMTEITITPHVGENGEPGGLAIGNIKPSSIFRRMGLRNGDILVGVDGQEIRSVDDALSLYENLKSADGVKVQINRRGQERIIDYNIR